MVVMTAFYDGKSIHFLRSSSRFSCLCPSCPASCAHSAERVVQMRAQQGPAYGCDKKGKTPFRRCRCLPLTQVTKAGSGLQSPVPLSAYPTLSVLLLAAGLASSAVFFV